MSVKTKLPNEFKEEAVTLIEIKNNIEDLKPFDVTKYDYPDEDIWLNDEALEDYNVSLRAKIPKWLHAYFWREDFPKKSPELHYSTRVDVIQFGDEYLQNNHIRTYPFMQTGALYEPDSNAWRMLKAGEALQTVRTDITKTLTPWGMYHSGILREATTYIQNTMYDTSHGDRSPFQNARPELVAFDNGVYNILTNTMSEGNSNYYLVNAHPYKIDPNSNQAPETERLLAGMFGADAVITLEEFIGYMFYHSHKPFQETLWLSGSGGEGKSGLIRNITELLLGTNNISAVKPADLAGGSRFSKANLYAKEANIVADIDKQHMVDTSALKGLTGGDIIEGEYKGAQAFTFTNVAKLLFSANELPTFSDTTDGFKARLMVIKAINGDTRAATGGNPKWWDQFDNAKVVKEAPAFAVLCMQKFNAALHAKSLSRPKSIEEATESWFAENDHFGQFLEEACEITAGVFQGESSRIVTEEYAAFCKENGFAGVMSTNSITKRLERYGVTKKQSRQGFNDHFGNTKRYLGLRLTKSYINEELFSD